jgi:hypothetical protein
VEPHAVVLIDHTMLHSDPYEAVAQLRRINDRVCGAVVLHVTEELIIADITLAPPLELAAHEYPREPVRVVSRRHADHPIAIPLRSGLSWFHRYPATDRDPLSGGLCLWYPRDPERLRWTWSAGFERFVALVHRHLLMEEGYRRGRPWPLEDAPHGERADGRAHPIIGRRGAA